MTHIKRIDEMVSQNENEIIKFTNPNVQKRFMSFLDICEQNGWNVSTDQSHRDNTIFIECQQYSNAGQDFSFTIDADMNASNVFFYALVREYIKFFDVEEEAKNWCVETGDYDEDGKPILQGTNGAPENYEDVVADMKDCKEMMETLEKMLRTSRI